MANVEKELENLGPTLNSSPPATFAQVKGDQICCVRLNSIWVRAKPVGNLDVHGAVPVLFIDTGERYAASLQFVRLLPMDAHYLRNIPPLASRFLLADVVVGDCVKDKEPTVQYLKLALRNKKVKAVTLGVHDSLEGVRLYLDNNLLARVSGRKCSFALKRSIY